MVIRAMCKTGTLDNKAANNRVKQTLSSSISVTATSNIDGIKHKYQNARILTQCTVKKY